MQWQKNTAPVLPVGLGFCVNILQCSIYWQQSSGRYFLRLFLVGERQTSFECHCWRWGNGTGGKTMPSMYLLHDLAEKKHSQLYSSWNSHGSCSWPADVGLSEEPTGHLLQAAFARSWLETEMLMAPVGWRLSPDGHPTKSSSAESDQKLFMLCSSQMGAKLWRTLLMPVFTQGQLRSRDLSASPLFPLKLPCSGGSVWRRLLSTYSFILTHLKLFSWGSKSTVCYTNKWCKQSWEMLYCNSFLFLGFLGMQL